ncbi:DNA double-strand break repair Rad50 ATPase [Heracleum sosnowskyi]|uniref:DNA double-strand break repair Rad50 ATPase n=1 Tax=Heracleum sosnowskyi TaxID=360622 RepID=A0AAD8MPU8_9APIA|nr:DNA double-strand break repair Rad50 ATPase [Heracleum sosnowskyi]
MDFYVSDDVRGLMSQFTLQEDRLRIKRRWLAGLPITKRDKRLIFGSNSKPIRTLPESLLREDDVFYETIKSFVQRGVNGNKEEKEQEALGKNIPPLNLPNDKRYLSSLLDYMTNECLCSVVDILTHGSVDFEKIRWKMIKVIKDYLRKLILSPNDDLFEKLSPLLKDPHSFRRIPVKFLDSSSQSYEASVLNILDGLDELPTCALLAMHRKVSGIGGYIPQVRPLRHGWKREKLIGFLRETCNKMLSAGEGDDSRESLNKAMGVAVLALKLIPGNQYVTDLTQFSPDVQVVQIEITKAIWFLNRSVRFPELKKLQLLLDPGSKLSNRSLRSAIRKFLTEYLFECSDMDSIPGWLLEALAVINQKSRSVSLQYFSKEDIEKEVECILSLGAHTKQIVWDLSVEHEFDYDFADSYMEDSEESDDGEYSDNDYVKNEPSDTSRFGSGERHNPSESITESISANFTTEPHDSQDFCSPPYAQNRTYKAELDSMQFTCISTVDSAGAFSLYSLKTKKTETESACVSPHSFNGHSVMKKEAINYSESNISCRDTSDKKIINKNPYLAIQGASDETSLFVYRLIGRLIEEFAQSEGLSLDLDYLAYLTSGEAKQQNEDQVAKEKSYCNKDGYGSVIFQTVQQLWPSFSQSGKNKLEEMMSSS